MGFGLFALRRPRLFFFGMATLLLLCAGNEIEYRVRQKRASEPPPSEAVVSAEQGPIGHNTLGIVESALRAPQGQTALTFATLGTWQFDRRANVPCPEPVKALNEKDVSCLGFMYPLESGDRFRVFCLLRSTQTCCYGPKPQFNQYLLVEMSEAVKFERLTPVLVGGKFFVDPKPDDGYIYRIEGRSVDPVEDDVPDVDAVQAAREAGLPLFDFAPLAAMEKHPDAERSIPAELLALDGTRAVLDGWVFDRTQGQPPELIVGHSPPSGNLPPALPTLFNAVLVAPRDARQIPPLWKQKAVFTGVVRVTREPAGWPDRGIVRLTDAVLGVPGAGSSALDAPRPLIARRWEAAAAMLLVLLAVRPRRSTHSEVPRG